MISNCWKNCWIVQLMFFVPMLWLRRQCQTWGAKQPCCWLELVSHVALRWCCVFYFYLLSHHNFYHLVVWISHISFWLKRCKLDRTVYKAWQRCERWRRRVRCARSSDTGDVQCSLDSNVEHAANRSLTQLATTSFATYAYASTSEHWRHDRQFLFISFFFKKKIYFYFIFI